MGTAVAARHLAGGGGGLDWTLVGVLATAVFTAVMAVILVRSFRLEHMKVGARSPILFKSAPASLDWQQSILGSKAYAKPPNARAVELHAFNLSERLEVLYIDAARVLWPRKVAPVVYSHFPIQVPPRDGAQIGFRLGRHGGWRSQTMVAGDTFYKRRCWLRVKFRRENGDKVVFNGLARMHRPFVTPSSLNPPKAKP